MEFDLLWDIATEARWLSWRLPRRCCCDGPAGDRKLDGVARQAEVSESRRLATEVQARSVVVTTSCEDTEVHRQRVEGRSRDIPGWHELDWDDVSRSLASWDPPAGADLHLDAMDPLEDNLALLAGLLKRQARSS